MKFRLWFNDKPSRIVEAKDGADLFIQQYQRREYPAKIEHLKEEKKDEIFRQRAS